MSDHINGHVDPAAWAELKRAEKANGVGFAGGTRSEVELLLKTIGRFVGAQVKPLQEEIAQLKERVAELEMTGIKYVGTYQRAAQYKRGDVCNYEGSMWVSTCDTPPMEVPGKSVCWQLSVKSLSRLPTKGGARASTVVEKRT